ncbi:zf-HC2 domain-containing protein [Cellulosimicrobium terreum]|nr:zf-HC2 domain-containing protein [Cellulosimicrobium terreum]
MTHLGSRLSALVDGQLTPAESERALEHVARCPGCAAELASARAARTALSSAGQVDPAPDLTARLLALSAEIPSAEGDPLRCAPRVQDPWGTTARPLPRGRWSGDLQVGRPRRRLVALALGGSGAVAVALFVLGQVPVVTPSLHRTDPLTVLAHAATARPVASVGDATTSGSDVAGADTLASLRAAGWSCPEALPVGVSVSAVRVLDDTLEIDLVTPSGEVVVREQAGRLDTASLDGLQTWDVSGRTIHVLSEEPWHLVWQSDDTVVDVVADVDEPDVADLVATFPAGDYDAGVPARISRGWTTMTGALGTS